MKISWKMWGLILWALCGVVWGAPEQDCPLGQLVDTNGRVWVPEAHSDYQIAIDQLMNVRELIPAFQGPLGDKVLDRVARPARVTHLRIEFPTDHGTREAIDGWRVIDYRNPNAEAKGGIRANDKVDLFEVAGFASWMTRKTQLAGVPYGGGKGGIRFERNYSPKEKAHIFREYIRQAFRSDAEAFGPGRDVPAPDGGTDGLVMRLFLDQMIVERLQRGSIADKALQAKLLESGVLERAKKAAETNPEQTLVLDKYKELAGDLANPRYGISELASITGKFPEDGGNKARGPATGVGVYFTIRETFKKMEGYESPDPARPLQGKTFAVLGFGNVGSHTGMAIEHRGGGKVTRVVEWAGKVDGKDRYLVLDNPNGIQTTELSRALAQWRKEGGEFQPPAGVRVSASGLTEAEATRWFIESNVDGLVPAGFGVQFSQASLTPQVLANMKAKFVFEGGNGPVDTQGDALLRQAGKTVLPGTLANQGGVVVSYLEYRQNLEGKVYEEQSVFNQLDGYITRSFDKTLDAYRHPQVDSLRKAADIVAISEIAEKVRQEIEQGVPLESELRVGASNP